MRKIVITGAATGIGKTTALACARAGFFVIAADRNSHGLRELQALLPPHRLETHLADLSQPEVYTSFISELYGTYSHRALHALINNTGPDNEPGAQAHSGSAPAESSPVSLKSLKCLSKDFAQRELHAPHARCIINITAQTVHGDGDGDDCGIGYRDNRYAVIGLTEANAWNFAPRVRVNAVARAAASGLATDSAADVHAADHQGIPLGQRHMIARHRGTRAAGHAEGVADVVMFLLSEQSRHLTGKVIAVGQGAGRC